MCNVCAWPKYSLQAMKHKAAAVAIGARAFLQGVSLEIMCQLCANLWDGLGASFVGMSCYAGACGSETFGWGFLVQYKAQDDFSESPGFADSKIQFSPVLSAGVQVTSAAARSGFSEEGRSTEKTLAPPSPPLPGLPHPFFTVSEERWQSFSGHQCCLSGVI